MSTELILAIVASIGAVVSAITTVVVASNARRTAAEAWVRDQKLDAYLNYIRAFNALRRRARWTRIPRPLGAHLHRLQEAESALELIGSPSIRTKADEVWVLSARIVATRRDGQSTDVLDQAVTDSMNELLNLMKRELGLSHRRRARARLSTPTSDAVRATDALMP